MTHQTEHDDHPTDPAQLRDAARQACRDALDAGAEVPSGKDLAGRFGKSERWGRDRVAEIRAERQAASTPASPAASTTASGKQGGKQTLAAASAPAPTGRPAVVQLDARRHTPNQANQAAAAAATEGSAENRPPFAQNRAQDATTAPAGPSVPDQGSRLSGSHSDIAGPEGAVDPTDDTDPAGIAATLAAPDAAVPGPTSDTVPATPAARTHAAGPAAPASTAAPASPAASSPTPGKASGKQGGKVPGRAVAWLSFAAGVSASVAANMLHAAGDATGADVAELVGAAFWPLALLAAIELLTRVQWPAGWWWGFGRYVGVGLVGIVAAVLSYRHMAGLLLSWGEDAWNAALGPLAVDGLMLVSATALLAISRTRAEVAR